MDNQDNARPSIPTPLRLGIARGRKTLELMSQGGLNLKDLLADPSNDSTPVEAMRAIMTRGKEHGWTTSQLFGVFLEVFIHGGTAGYCLVYVFVWGSSSRKRVEALTAW